MMKLTAIAFLAIVLNSQCASDDVIVEPVAAKAADELALEASQDPAILEVNVDGIGKATIVDRTILVKLPADYAKSTVRLTYKVTEGVKKITPTSGQDIPVRADQPQTVCIQTDASGNCTLPYQLIIQSASTLRISLDPASRQLDVTRYLQPYGLTFQLGNLRAQTGVTRQFQLRFVNKATGYSYTGSNYMVNDKAGNVVFINQPNVTVPEEGQLRMTGTLPLDMPTGDYAISILMPTCYSPTADGRCLSLGTEGVDLTESFVLRPGPALVGEISPVLTAANDLVVKGRNFSTNQPVAARLSNDFTQPTDLRASVESETLARLPVPATLPGGQYRLDVSPAGGQPYSILFTAPGANVQPSFAYVALLGNYVATQNALPSLSALKGGETLEVRYGTGSQTVKALRLVDVKDPKHTVDLTGSTAFRPYAGATDFVMWKWTVPTGVPKGSYALVFEATDGALSLPYYQKIQIE